MRKVGDLMKEIGFNKDSSEDVQKAFIKNLIKQAYGVEVKEPRAIASVASQAGPSKPAPQQLSFDLGAVTDSAPKKPISA